MPQKKGTLTVAQKLEQLGEDVVMERLRGGESMSSIARSIGSSVAAVHVWIEADDKRSARAKTARTKAAQAYAEKAEETLLNAPANQFELTRARELAHHYRWMAKNCDPARFGDRVKAEMEHSGKVDVGLSIEQAKAIAAEFNKANES